MQRQQYDIRLSASGSTLYPVLIGYGNLWCTEDMYLSIPPKFPYKGEWGTIQMNCELLQNSFCMPFFIEILYLSVVEHKFYYLENELPYSMEKEYGNSFKSGQFTHVVIGMAPYGGIAVWIRGSQKSVLISWMKGKEIDVDMAAFNPTNPEMSLKEYCDFYINNDEKIRKNLEHNGLPERNYFDKLMQQFCYRYLVLAERWDGERWLPLGEKDAVPEIDWVEEVLWDGTHDKLHDGSLMRYHAAGKPRKLAVKFHVGKDEYSAYFWMDEVRTREIFDRFYGAHRDTKCDFIIHIDPESRRYELALFRYGLQEPQVLPADAFEVLVFKNRFEHYRSDNYSQPRGAWIW